VRGDVPRRREDAERAAAKMLAQAEQLKMENAVLQVRLHEELSRRQKDQEQIEEQIQKLALENAELKKIKSE